MMPTFQEHFLNGAFVSEWMPSSEAAKAVQEHYGCPLDVAYTIARKIAAELPRLPIERADEIVKDLYGRTKKAIDLTQRDEYWRRESFFYLLERHKEPGMRPVTRSRKLSLKPAKTKSATPNRCREALTKYEGHLAATDESRSMDGFEAFAKTLGLAGQKALRKAYQDKYKTSPGRPSKR